MFIAKVLIVINSSLATIKRPENIFYIIVNNWQRKTSYFTSKNIVYITESFWSLRGHIDIRLL